MSLEGRGLGHRIPHSPEQGGGLGAPSSGAGPLAVSLLLPSLSPCPAMARRQRLSSAQTRGHTTRLPTRLGQKCRSFCSFSLMGSALPFPRPPFRESIFTTSGLSPESPSREVPAAGLAPEPGRGPRFWSSDRSAPKHCLCPSLASWSKQVQTEPSQLQEGRAWRTVGISFRAKIDGQVVSPRALSHTGGPGREGLSAERGRAGAGLSSGGRPTAPGISALTAGRS